MSQFLFHYHEVAPTTWVYLSSLLMVGLFFKFSRFWSIRNLDLIMLIALAPGLLLVHYGNQMKQDAAASRNGPEATTTQPGNGGTDQPFPAATNGVNSAQRSAVAPSSADLPRSARIECLGYRWLFACGCLWLARMFLDMRLVRRPLLLPNLSVGGLTFIGVALFVFLMANVVVDLQPVDPPQDGSGPTIVRMDRLLAYQQDRGPGYAALNALPESANKTIAVLSHLAIVIGLVIIGSRHFDNYTNGIGAATLYLMLPYTAQMTSRVDHFLPAALLTLAIACYRRPVASGILVGAASGCVYYPLFTIPLWISFYWRRGWVRFLIGVASVLALMTVLLGVAPHSGSFLADLQRMFGIVRPAMENLMGVWNTSIGGWDPQFRIPVLTAFFVLSLGMAIWPAQKNLGTLISCTATIMLASQFWHGFGGALFVAWYLPLTLLMVFRPNLENRVAEKQLDKSWVQRRRERPATKSRAA